MRPSAYASLAPCFVSGERSPVAEVRACLARLDAVAPKLNAFVHVARETALSGAEESERRWRSNAAFSPIDGMAIGVKDIIETEDMPTGQGSPMWEGFHTRRDAACVQALREAGAIILGKTTTTEFAATEPLMPVRNPHDPARTAGGSSSASAPAVGAGILPATPEDAWTVASAIVARVGGDPGHPGLRGPSEIAPASPPRRLAMLETAAWPKASAGAQAAFGQARERLAELGAEIADRRSDPSIAAVEDAIADAVAVTFAIFDWEFRWPLGNYAKRNGLSEGMRRRLASAQQMTLDDYRAALRRREEIRKRYADASGRFDGFVTLAATGAAPVGLTWTGDPAFNVPASLLGVPAISLSFLQDERMPLGLQIIGRADEDAQLMGCVQWLWQNY